MQVDQILSEIDSEIERLQQARNILAGASGAATKRRGAAVSASPKPVKKRGGRRRMSAEARKRLSDALKARWAERRKRTATKASK